MKLSTLVAAVLIALAVEGCASAPPPPEDHYYRLLAPRTVGRSDEPVLRGTVLVRRLRAEGLLGDRAIAYSRAAAPNVLNQYRYHFWNDPPTVLLQHFAADYLRAAGVAGQVLLPELGVEGMHEVVGNIRRFEHLRGDAETVEISIELGLIEIADERLLLLETYENVQPVRGKGMDSVLRAFDGAVSQVFARFAQDIARLR